MKKLVFLSALVLACGSVKKVKVNSAPVPVVASTEIQAIPFQPVLLDASESYDPDGDPVYYQWELKSSPTGSEPVLGNRESAVAFLYPDLPGAYEVSFSVSDGELVSSVINLTVVVSDENVKPYAFIGEKLIETEFNQSVFISGVKSVNPVQSPLSYEWEMVSMPSATTLSFPAPVSLPYFTFSPDVSHGEYIVVLKVSNEYAEGTTDWVKILVKNRTPQVKFNGNVVGSYTAGSSLYVVDRDNVEFDDYSVFNDPDGDVLSYHWSFTYDHVSGTVPQGHGFICPSSGSGVFNECDDTPDRVVFTVGNSADGEGLYTINLEVSDGYTTVNKTVILMRNGAPPPSISVDDYSFDHEYSNGKYTAEGLINFTLENLYSASVNADWKVEVKKVPESNSPFPVVSPSAGTLSIPASSQTDVQIYFAIEEGNEAILGKYILRVIVCLEGTDACSSRTFFVYVRNNPPSVLQVPDYIVFNFKDCTFMELGGEQFYVGTPSVNFLLPIYAEDPDNDPLEVEVTYGASTLPNLISFEGDFVPVLFVADSGVEYEKNLVLCALPWTCGISSWGWPGAERSGRYTEAIVSVRDAWSLGPIKKVKIYPECQ